MQPRHGVSHLLINDTGKLPVYYQAWIFYATQVQFLVHAELLVVLFRHPTRIVPQGQNSSGLGTESTTDNTVHVHNTCSHLLNVQRYKAVISHIGLVRLSCSKMESSNPDLAPKLAKLSKVFWRDTISLLASLGLPISGVEISVSIF